jgi:hypothetical protein
MEVTKANLATYLAGLTPSATPYPIEIIETVASDWGSSNVAGTVGNIINTNTPSGVYLDLGLTIIPSSVSILYYTFLGCTSLTTEPVIPNSVPELTGTFRGCTSLTTAPIIPNSVVNINQAFRDCTSLTTAPIIPNSVVTMYQAFYGCTLLHTIQNFAVDVDNCIMTNAFLNCPALANIYVTTLSESTWHLLHTDTDATGTDYTIYNPDGTVAGSGTVAGTSQVLTLYGKSDELVISANITPTLAEETATSQVQWHKSGLPYDDELLIFNAKNPTTVISNVLITTIRKDANFTLGAYADGQKIRIANTHATNTITCTLPSGQTILGRASIPLGAGCIVELELIGTDWKSVSETVLVDTMKGGVNTIGYIKYSSGRMIQRTGHYNSSSSGWITLNWPISFTNNIVVATASFRPYVDILDSSAPAIGGVSKTQVRVNYVIADRTVIVEGTGYW